MDRNNRRFELLLAPGFLLALVLLLLNDFYLKEAYANFLTGKLSDFAGLFCFSIFLSVIFPRHARSVHIGVAVVFILWKTPLADPLIGMWNSLGILSIERTIDYSDYLALAVLPLAYLYLGAMALRSPHRFTELQRAASYLVVVTSVFAFTATSSSTYRSVTLPEIYAVRESRVEIEAMLLRDPGITKFVPRMAAKGEKFGNFTLEESLYYFDFEIDERTCDSRFTRMSFMVTDRPDRTELAAIYIEFDCSAYAQRENINSLDRSYIEHAREVFKRRILNRLTPVDK